MSIGYDAVELLKVRRMIETLREENADLRAQLAAKTSEAERLREVASWCVKRPRGWEIKTPEGQSAFWHEGSGIIASVMHRFCAALAPRAEKPAGEGE